MTSIENDNKFLSDENCPSKSDILEVLTDKSAKVCSFRDRYFENHSLEDAIHKNDESKKLQEETIKIFEENETAATKINKAKYFFMKGALLNVLPEYSVDAENLLSKAIKLDRKLVHAWNELGDCYWKNDEFKKAKSCFEGALKEEKNKVSSRNLSMLSRQELVNTQDERIANVEKGLNYAKEAVQSDPSDGVSWGCLGNANLSYFFQVQQNPKISKQAMSAYFHAEKDVVAKSQPDLHYNKGIISKYKEQFKEALESFKISSLYEPTWDRPKKKEQESIEYLNGIVELVSTKGKSKKKKLRNILASIDSKHLGPYLEDTKNILTGADAKLTRVNIKELKPGVNESRVLLGKVVCSVRNEDTVPFTFCLVDETGDCIVVTLFNLADGKGVIIGDSIAIPEPLVTDVDFEFNSVEYKFRLIRVETPILVAVNGKLLQKDQTAGVQMSIFRKFD